MIHLIWKEKERTIGTDCFPVLSAKTPSLSSSKRAKTSIASDDSNGFDRWDETKIDIIMNI